MSKEARIGLPVAVVGCIGATVQGWYALKDHDGVYAFTMFAVSVLALLAIVWGVVAMFRGSQRFRDLESEIITVKDDCKTQIASLNSHHRAEMDRLVKIVQGKQDEIAEMEARFGVQVEQYNKVIQEERERVNQSAMRFNRLQEAKAKEGTSAKPFYGGEVGVKIESAMFGAAGHEPQDVTARVKELVAKGEKAIPASHHVLLDGTDPRFGVMKFLTLTISKTGAEATDVFI